jgi:hypothetical protein
MFRNAHKARLIVELKHLLVREENRSSQNKKQPTYHHSWQLLNCVAVGADYWAVDNVVVVVDSVAVVDNVAVVDYVAVAAVLQFLLCFDFRIHLRIRESFRCCCCRCLQPEEKTRLAKIGDLLVGEVKAGGNEV